MSADGNDRENEAVAATSKVEEDLPDRHEFALDDDAWLAFMTLLNRPVVAKPRLQELFSQDSIFEPGR